MGEAMSCCILGCNRNSGLDGDGYCWQHRQSIPVWKISLNGGGTYFASMDDIRMALEGEIDGADEGTILTLELIFMHPRKYKELPDFEGH